MKLTVGFIRLSKPWRNTKRGIQSFSFQTLWYVRFEDLLVVMINTLLFWLVTPCTLVDIPTFLRRFSCSEMSHLEDEGSAVIWIVKNYTWHDMTWHHSPAELNLKQQGWEPWISHFGRAYGLHNQCRSNFYLEDGGSKFLHDISIYLLQG